MGGYSNFRRCTRQLQIDYDTWYYIFEKLDSAIDQNSFGLTCVTFRDIRNSSRKCLKLRCSTTNTTVIIDSSIIDKMLSRHTQLETLTLGCCNFSCRHITDSCLTSLVIFCSRLHSLNLDRCFSVTDKGVSFVATACPLLSTISLNLTSVTDHGLENLSKSCKSLKEVSLQYCVGVTDDGIFILNQNCRQLRELRISGCKNIHGVGFRQCSPSLSVLEANECCLSSRGVSHIVSGGGLEYLYLSWSCAYLNPIGLGGFCSKLKILDISGCSIRADDDVIVQISRGCPLLQELDLSYCNGIGSFDWEAIGLYCQNLDTLHIAHCDDLCDRGLLSIAAGCKRLSVITIQDIHRYKDKVKQFRSQRKDVEIKTRESF